MAVFDFITTKEFREALESDYAEMRRCAEGAAWKSVQVLAGSIVESLLVDYLLTTPHPTRGSIDPLRIDLAAAITICRDEYILSQRAADLCSVIRSYRNLIHPGRVVRLGEQPPDSDSATIAVAVVDLITKEVAAVRRAAVGLTAEQILSKLQRDENATTILKHLLGEVSEAQRERLLLNILPLAHAETPEADEPFDDRRERLSLAFRTTLDVVSDATRKKVAQEFVRIVRDEDGDVVTRYSAAFFRPSDVGHLLESQQPMVIDHLLARVGSTHGLASLVLLKGIGPYLRVSDAAKWVDPFVRTLVSNVASTGVKRAAREHFLDELNRTSVDFDGAVIERLKAWIQTFEKAGAKDKAQTVLELKDEFESFRVPF